MKKWSLKTVDNRIWLVILNIFLVVVCLIVGNAADKSKARLYSQQMAARWESEKHSYAQVSAFISEGRDVNPDIIRDVRGSIYQKLNSDSLYEEKDGARVWIDAYSGECKVSLRRDSASLSVTAVGVGGDFFQFHPMKLLSGNYISSQDLNLNRIVVDENFAWAMFGSNDIEGMQVWLDETIYTVAGVVEVPDDPLYRTVYGSGNKVYMNYETLRNRQEDLTITCYEAVLPNPISNYAYYALRKAFGLAEDEEDSSDTSEVRLSFDSIEVLENTNRFDFVPLYNQFKNRKYRVMRAGSVGYPMWENLARVEEDKQIDYFLAQIVLLICPVVSLVLLLYRLWKKKTWTVKGVVIAQAEKVRANLYEKAEERRRAKEAAKAEREEESEAAESVESVEDVEEVEAVEDAEDFEAVKGVEAAEEVEDAERVGLAASEESFDE